MRIRNSAPSDSERGVTAGGSHAQSSSERCHVTFTDQSDSDTYSGSSTSKMEIEGFQRDLMSQRKQRKQQLPSQQHLNPLFDIPDSVASVTNAKDKNNSGGSGSKQQSPTDEERNGSCVGVGGSTDSAKSPTLPKPLILSSALAAEKPALNKRQSTKQLLKPKNALEVEVGARDTMEKIAIRYRTTPSEICKMNKMASRMIFQGQVLFVPDPDASPVTPSPTKEGTGADLMFPSSDEQQQQKRDVGESGQVEGDVPKLPSLPSLPSFTSVTAITDGVTVASKDAGAAASSQFSSLFSKLNPATAISRTSLRKKNSDGKSDNKKDRASSASDSDPDKECLERFLKLNAKYITNGRGVVSGTLLVTPNAIMFDPYVMDRLVIEHSPEEYGMMAPMECIMSATLYHDISRMNGKSQRADSDALRPAFRGSESESRDHPDDGVDGHLDAAARSTEHRLSVALGDIANPKRDKSLVDSKESSASLELTSSSENPGSGLPTQHHLVKPSAAMDLDDSVFESTSSQTKEIPSPTQVLSGTVDEGAAKPALNAVSTQLQSTNAENNPRSLISSSNPLTNLHKTKDIAEIDVVGTDRARGGAPSRIVHAPGSTVWYADLPTTSSKTSGGNSPTVQAVEVENVVDPDTKERLFQPLPDNVLNATSSLKSTSMVPPLFLCLKVGQPLNKNVPSSGPFASYARKKKYPEYWFSIPKDKASRLYAFFLQWTPEVYDNRDDRHQQAFVAIGNYEDDSVDDFLKQLQISREWEIINTDEIERRRSVLSMDESALFPDFNGESSIFDEELVKKIVCVMPPRVVGYPWTLTFSTEQNGFSLKSLYRKMSSLPQGPVLLFIKDTNDKIFGAMSSCTFVVSDHFYGNGEMFLFSLLDDGELRHWPWSGENNYFIKGNKESLAIGAGEGLFGLWLDEDLYHGRSHPCSTFGNECLSSKEDFVIKALEIWAFIS